MTSENAEEELFNGALFRPEATVDPAAHAARVKDAGTAAVYGLSHGVFAFDERLEGDALEALLQWLRLLAEAFPDEKGRAAFSTLLSWSETASLSDDERAYPSLAADAWEANLVRWAGEAAPQAFREGLLDSPRWEWCAPSVPDQRGYTCGLWTLFHSLAAETRRDRAVATFRAIRGFVERSFGCTDCVQHFLAANPASVETGLEGGGRQEASLWLWKAHNGVNARLKDDDWANDPAFPKVQWPASDECPACRTEGAWDEDAVSDFLLRTYAEDGGSILRADELAVSATPRFRGAPAAANRTAGLLAFAPLLLGLVVLAAYAVWRRRSRALAEDYAYEGGMRTKIRHGNL
jgi:hypothetical protein